MGALKDKDPVQPHISKQEGAEGHHRTLRRGASHTIKPLCISLFCGVLTAALLHLKRLRPRAGKGPGQVTQLLAPPTTPTVGLLSISTRRERPLRVRETRMNLPGFLPGTI